MTAEPVLVATGLRKEYAIQGGAPLVAVDDVSFSIEPGASMAIVGESGSGKTTIAKMLIGLERPDGGTINIAGTDRSRPDRRASARRQRGRDVQIVFQDPYTSLDRRQSVGDCLAEVVKLHFGSSDGKVKDRVQELGQMVGLDERQMRSRPHALSGGQRQRVAIARALAAKPKVLILDESVAALDVSIQAHVLNLLADIREETGITYLLISHDLAVVRQITDTAIVMRKGKVVESGSTQAILDDPQDDYTRLLRDSVPRPGWKPVSRRITSAQSTAPQEHS